MSNENKQPDDRAAFEEKFAIPAGAYWNGERYAARDGYENSYAIERHGGRWEGWKAARATAPQATVKGDEPTREVIETLTEPVYIKKAMLGGRNACVVLSGGNGPKCAVFLVNIQITSWSTTKEWAEGYAMGFNQAAAWMQDAILTRAAVPQAEQRMSDAEREVLAERARQVSEEGWTPEHDDAHACDEIAAFAAIYAMPEGARDWPTEETGYGATLSEALTPDGWQPKFGDRRRDLIKAGALILAEIERIDRAARKGASE